MRTRLLTTVLSSLALCLGLASCSDAPKTQQPIRPDTSQLVSQITSHCTDLDAPELGTGKLCIDNGFRINSDDFSFSNWGRSTKADENVTAQTLVDLFGHESVCMPGTKTECVLRPTTKQKIEEWNNALSGGRCEGLATLSTRFHLNMDHPSNFQENAQRVSELSRNKKELQQSVVYWWATQFLNEVADRAATSRTKTPLHIVDELIQGLANGIGYTLGLYDKSSGHSVTPFAVTHRDTQFVIHVYDNNFPGKRREILVDSVANTWRYKGAIVGVDGQESDWAGSTGALELTPMSARQGPFECFFCNTPTRKSPVRISLASRDPRAPGYLLVTTQDGKTFSTSPNGITSSIPQARYTIGKGAAGNLVTVDLPSNIGNFSVQVLRASSVIPAGDVVVSLQRSGSATIQVSGNLAHSAVNSTRGKTLLNVRAKDTVILAPLESRARVSLASASNLSRVVLDAGSELVVGKIAKDQINIALKGAAMEQVKTKVKASIENISQEIELSLVDGNINQTSSIMQPVAVTPQLRQNFEPRTALTTTTVPTSIVIALPD